MHFERIADKLRLNFIVSEIGNSAAPGSLVLDVGCGNGIIAKSVASNGFRVEAIDVSEKTIQAARELNPHDNINYKVVAAGELPIQANRFSAIICSEVLEHLHRPGELLKILHASLKDDGVLIVTVPNGRGPRELFVTKPVQYLQRKNNPLSTLFFKVKKWMGYTGTTIQSSADDLSHIQFFTVKSLRKLALENGFQIVRFGKSNFVEQVFPFSLAARRSAFLQKLDCSVATHLPLSFTSGFMMVWKKQA